MVAVGDFDGGMGMGWGLEWWWDWRGGGDGGSGQNGVGVGGGKVRVGGYWDLETGESLVGWGGMRERFKDGLMDRRTNEQADGYMDWHTENFTFLARTYLINPYSTDVPIPNPYKLWKKPWVPRITNAKVSDEYLP
jgi:hypothetical protein